MCLLEMRSLNHHQTESVCISATQTALTNLEVTGLFSALTGKEKDSTLMLMDCLQCAVNLDNFSKVKVGVLRPVQQPGSYWDRSSELPLVGLEPTEVTAYD